MGPGSGLDALGNRLTTCQSHRKSVLSVQAVFRDTGSHSDAFSVVTLLGRSADGPINTARGATTAPPVITGLEWRHPMSRCLFQCRELSCGHREQFRTLKAVPWLRPVVAASHRGVTGLIPSQSIWDLRSTKWYWDWDRFLSRYSRTSIIRN